jgi:hypothetical protein
MRALDHLRSFCAALAGGISMTRHLPDREGNEQSSLPGNDQPSARTRQTARDDETRARPLSGSYPAVWPR